MKKISVVFLIVGIFFIGNAYVISKKNNNISFNNNMEIKGIYISYLEYLTYFQGNSVNINKAYINKMLDNIESLEFNTIFLHVSPFSDAIYNSKLFPYSYTLTGIEGNNPGIDYLKYFIEEAHKRNLAVHAWINPYRISSTTDTMKLSNNNIALEFISNGDAKICETGIYYNPASPRVLDLLLKQISEIITNYKVDGIHIDDYFYPDNSIDIKEYDKYFLENNITLDEYRLNIINTTIRSIYKLIKSYNKDIIFSISPDGNIENNYEIHFADVKKWLSEDGYVDIIMPQVYYGFEHESKPFEKVTLEWNNLITNNVKLIPVLAFYKVGLTDIYAGGGKDEWVNNSNIIRREINYSKTLSKYNGYTLFRYDYLFNSNLANTNTKREIDNFKLK
ncbi:MAG: family 10 glycosylhydrolase [Bacilli bacterium]|nr:family 10 glycosylhydrolase [Bacilli bacterium]